MARIPARQASSSDRERLRTLEESLERVVFGQHEAVHLVAQAIKRSRAGLGEPDRPAGCFLFTGPTGVGKTELAKQLAMQLGNEFIRFDMSEYMEKHAVARLIGAPPGYVGFEQGGLLVDAVRTHPYSVVLLDEIEKAHPDIYNILLQVMDHADADRQHRPQGRLPQRRADPDVQRRLARDERAVDRLLATTAKTPAAADIQGGDRADLQPGVPQPARRDRHLPPLTPAAMETIVEKFVLQLESAARRAARRDHADARSARLARREGLRLRSSAPGRSGA